MGVLDDAIRQHIELKRKHGASEQDLEREKAEALGPVRREAPAEPEPELEAAPELEEITPEPVGEGDLADDVFEAPGREPAPTHPEPTSGETPARGFAPVEDPAPRSGRRPLDDDPFSGDEPFADETTAEPEPVAEDDEGDVLEKTPEFLEETPEHDRLWFEQKPPRDFDFDDK